MLGAHMSVDCIVGVCRSSQEVTEVITNLSRNVNKEHLRRFKGLFSDAFLVQQFVFFVASDTTRLSRAERRLSWLRQNN